MNWETLKNIYQQVLKYKNTIRYNGENKYTITHHYPNGNKCWEAEYQNDQLHGKCIGWWENGNKWWEAEYQNGLQHGKDIGWDKNGKKIYKAEYKNGKQIR